ncbi:MAG TPA: ADOP family duplicated permease, partial [Solirubrobacterales bacterium]
VRVEGARLSAASFDLLGVRPVHGRAFLPEEDSPHAGQVVLLGWEIWQTRYGGDPRIVGSPVRVNGMPATVVGVMPRGFGFPVHQQLWQPLRLDPVRLQRGPGRTVEVFGRLREGATLEQARAEMTRIARGIAEEAPATNQGRGVVVVPYAQKYLGDGPAQILYAMLGACLLVLLLACTNLAALTTARASQRMREMALRAALGSSRGRLVRQIVIETLLTAILGAALALPLAHAAVRTFRTLVLDRPFPFWVDLSLDPRAVLFAAGLMLAAGLASGLLPALQASRADVAGVLKDEGRASSLRMGWTTRAIVVFEVAVSCVLLVGAGLMIQNVRHVQTRTGFRTEHLFTARISLSESGYSGNPERVRFVAELLRRLREDPAVVTAAVSSYLPATGSGSTAYALEGEAYAAEKDYPVAHMASVSTGFFESFGLHILQGRDFAPEDRPGSLPVVVVNQSFAQRSWPGQDPLGRRIRIALNGRGDEPWRTVVGVVPDLAMEYVSLSDDGAGFYLPLSQEGAGVISLVIGTRDPDPLTITRRVREHVADLDRDLPIYYVFSMQQAVDIVGFFPRFFASAFSIFGLSALLLASVGIYGVLAFSVQRRTPEIGIRMALGARRGSVLALVFRRGIAELLAGLGLGLLLTWPAARVLSGTLVGIDPGDPPTYAAVTVLLVAVSLLACWLPARRASLTDPNAAIRYD